MYAKHNTEETALPKLHALLIIKTGSSTDIDELEIFYDNFVLKNGLLKKHNMVFTKLRITLII